jgi:hypothetical protein
MDNGTLLELSFVICVLLLVLLGIDKVLSDDPADDDPYDF